MRLRDRPIGDLHEMALYECERRGWRRLRRLVNLVYAAHLALLRAFIRGLG
jgi:hypothetical protein